MKRKVKKRKGFYLQGQGHWAQEIVTFKQCFQYGLCRDYPLVNKLVFLGLATNPVFILGLPFVVSGVYFADQQQKRKNAKGSDRFGNASITAVVYGP